MTCSPPLEPSGDERSGDSDEIYNQARTHLLQLLRHRTSLALLQQRLGNRISALHSEQAAHVAACRRAKQAYEVQVARHRCMRTVPNLSSHTLAQSEADLATSLSLLRALRAQTGSEARARKAEALRAECVWENRKLVVLNGMHRAVVLFHLTTAVIEEVVTHEAASRQKLCKLRWQIVVLEMSREDLLTEIERRKQLVNVKLGELNEEIFRAKSCVDLCGALHI